jgi:acetoacetyl-CoA synthetase
MMISEVHEELVPKVHAFLCQAEEFGQTTHWEPLFNYSWKTDGFPFGYAIVDGEDIRGFLGTVFAKRTIQGESILSCNMTTWLVSEKYRVGLGKAGKGLGRRLVEPLLARKNAIVTNFTPNLPSAKSCESMGFRRLDSEQIVVPLIPGFKGWPRFTSSEELSISFSGPEISSRLTERELKIYQDHRDLPCKHFLISSPKNGDYCYGIATISSFQKLASIGGNSFNLCYLSDSEFFARHFRSFAGLLWKENRIAVLRYDKRLINQPISKLARKVPVTRLFHSASPDLLEMDLLYSELVLYNKYC